jgi:hypothetical protein
VNGRRGRRVAILIALAASTGAFAATAKANAVDPRHTVIDSRAKLTHSGRMVRVTGQVRCGACARLVLAVTVSQRGGGLAQGGVRCVCQSATERWIVNARVRQATKLQSGRARICTWVIAQGADAKPLDAYQWCRDVTLA